MRNWENDFAYYDGDKFIIIGNRLMGFISWLTLILITLKLLGVISWSWFYVFMPAIADLVISVLILVVAKMIWDK